jgi:hypothetical protein
MQVDCLTFDFNETQDFDAKFQVLQKHVQKWVVQVLDTFISFMLLF